MIQELHSELLVPVTLFYLILRGMDTIEDDMTISLEEKDPLLREFYKVTEQDGWNYDGNGPNEKDRDLLVKFHFVVEEFKKIKPVYRGFINDITQKMGNGMADYCHKAKYHGISVESVKDYDLYCHYVAGLVGAGLTLLFVESGLANPALLDRPHLQESMGLFLQKTNIIRDVKEDFDDNRRFWPKEIWSKHVSNFEDLFDPKNREAALNCSSDMVLNSLGHADECLFYLAGLKEQSVFNFAAIPQTMAIATLELVFRNPKIFERNVKITKGQACQIMVDSTQNLRKVCDVFRRYARAIHKKNTPRDPNFLKISIACGKVFLTLSLFAFWSIDGRLMRTMQIEQFMESMFPSQDPKAIAAMQSAQAPVVHPEEAEQRAMAEEAKWDTSKCLPPPLLSSGKAQLTRIPVYLLALVMGFLFVLSTIMVNAFHLQLEYFLC